MAEFDYWTTRKGTRVYGKRHPGGPVGPMVAPSTESLTGGNIKALLRSPKRGYQARMQQSLSKKAFKADRAARKAARTIEYSERAINKSLRVSSITADLGLAGGTNNYAAEFRAAQVATKRAAFPRSFAGRAAKMGKGMWGLGKGAAGLSAGVVSAFSNPWVGGGLIAAGLVAGVAGGIFAGLSGSRPQRQTPAGYATQTMGAGYPTFFASHGPMSSTNLSTGGLTQALYNTRRGGQH